MITQDVAVIPFLWIVPLSLYLITFIVAFDSPKWYNRYFWIPAFLRSLPVVVYLLKDGAALNILIQVTLYSSCMFCGSMVCHGVLARLKPHPRHLTLFFLFMALGGAIGGLFVNFGAPVLFSGFWEFHLALILTCFLAGLALLRSTRKLPARGVMISFSVAWVAGIATFTWLLLLDVQD